MRTLVMPFCLVLVCLALVGAGCSQQADVILFNRSGGEIRVESPVEQPVTLPDSTSVTFKFPGEGRRLILRLGQERQEYALTQFPPRELRGKAYPYTVTLAVNRDGGVYVCTPDGRQVVPQPDGFPLQPRAAPATTPLGR
jgi:hypothetical protein